MEDRNLKLFCDNCGTLIFVTTEGTIRCQLCHNEYDARYLEHCESTVIVEEKVEEKQPEMATEMSKRTMINERCCNPECSCTQLYFSTAQLRSADEGQTIFYECPECGHRWQQNA